MGGSFDFIRNESRSKGWNRRRFILRRLRRRWLHFWFGITKGPRLQWHSLHKHDDMGRCQ